MAEECQADYSDETSDLYIPCNPCSRNNKRSEAVIYCADCDEVQCLICSKDHETYIVMGHHVTVDIKDWRHSSLSFDLAKITKCEIHGLFYQYYCTYDNRLCCQECRNEEHRTCCNVKLLSTMEHRVSARELESVDMKFKKLLDEAEVMVSRSEVCKASVQSQVAALPSVIGDVRKQLLHMLDKFEETMREEGRCIADERMATLKEIQNRTSVVVSDIQNTLINIKYLPRSMTPELNFVFEKKMEEILEDYNRKVKLQATKLSKVGDTISIEYSDKLLDLLRVSPVDIGKLNTATDHVGSDCLLEPKPVELKEIRDTSMPSVNGFKPFYIGMDFLQNGRLVLADNRNNACIVMSTSLKVIGEKCLKYAPQDLLVFGSDQLLISSGEGQFIDHYEVNSVNILTYKNRIATLSPCDSLSLIVENTFTVGIADKTKPVCTLKDFNQVLDFEMAFDRENYKLGETKCAYSQSLEILVLTDYVTNTIAIINTRTGEKIRVQDKVIQGPRSVVIGKDGSIFVCCEGSCCLTQLSHSGDILTFRQLYILSPHSICISKDFSKLAISNNCADDCHLQLFSIV